MYCLEYHFVLSALYLGVKAQQCLLARIAVSLVKKTLLKSWLNPGSKLTIFRGTGACSLSSLIFRL